MLDIFRKLLFGALFIAAFVALLTVALSVALGLVVVGIVFWIYLKLRKAGIIGEAPSASVDPHYHEQMDHDSSSTVIEAEYEVVEKETK